MTDVAQLLASHPLFEGCSAPRLDGLIPRVWRRNDVLFREGDPPIGLVLIFEGRVRIHRCSPEGRRHVLHEESSGGSLGEVPLFAGDGMAGTAVAVLRTSGVVIPPDLARSAITGQPELARRVLERLAKRVRILADRLDQVTTQRVRSRLAAKLLERSKQAAGATWSIGMTQRELAEDLGSVREVVVRELRGLCRQGAIEARGGGRYRVADGRLLAALAGLVEPKFLR